MNFAKLERSGVQPPCVSASASRADTVSAARPHCVFSAVCKQSCGDNVCQLCLPWHWKIAERISISLILGSKGIRANISSAFRPFPGVFCGPVTNRMVSWGPGPHEVYNSVNPDILCKCCAFISQVRPACYMLATWQQQSGIHFCFDYKIASSMTFLWGFYFRLSSDWWGGSGDNKVIPDCWHGTVDCCCRCSSPTKLLAINACQTSNTESEPPPLSPAGAGWHICDVINIVQPDN